MVHQLRQYLAVLIILPLLLVNVGCSNSDAVKVGNALHDVGIAVGGLQTAVNNARISTPQLISDTNALTILTICDKINQGGLQASALTRQYSTLPTGSKPQLAAIVTPILTAINNAIASGLISISDANTKANIMAILQSIKTSLLIVQT